MKAFAKHLLLDLGVVFGNILLSLGIFGLMNVVIYFLQGIAYNGPRMEHMVFILMGAPFIAINILLYKFVLKKHFKPAEQKRPSFYILLPVILIVIWIAAHVLSMFLHFSWLLFSAVLLTALILFTIVCCRYIQKFVGEAYYVYLTSLFGVSIMPGAVLLLAMSLG